MHIAFVKGLKQDGCMLYDYYDSLVVPDKEYDTIKKLIPNIRIVSIRYEEIDE